MPTEGQQGLTYRVVLDATLPSLITAALIGILITIVSNSFEIGLTFGILLGLFVFVVGLPIEPKEERVES